MTTYLLKIESDQKLKVELGQLMAGGKVIGIELASDDQRIADIYKLVINLSEPVVPDELLNVSQLCEKIEGLTRHTFAKLRDAHKLKCTGGKYSLKSVKAALSI